uniref:E3 ubiquitin-protein ligase E3D n=1 Tax=Stomoxys calcitrans TaxID=35570 RepID=A0A1I8Q8H3_STOCA
MLRFVVIELRQHLSCANVFLTFQESMDALDSLRINVEDSLIRLRHSCDSTVAEVNVAKYFTILTESFSNLVVEGENVSFRISVQNIKDVDRQQNDIDKALENPKFQLEEGQMASLHCKQCDSSLCGGEGSAMSYNKVREFPSGAIDMSEFFCHHGPNFGDVLMPRTQDMFYGFLFIILNMENIRKSTKEREGHLYCGRCNRYLGETQFEGKAAKLWTESVVMKLNSVLDPLELFDHKPQQLIQMLMLKIINETSLPSPEPLLRNLHFTKVLLEACRPNRQQQYLLVQILEKNLPILKNDQELDDVTPSKDVFIHLLKVDLETHFAFKLLYRLIEVTQPNEEEADESSTEPAMLSYWQQDINILKMRISPFLFQSLVDELNVNSELLPEMYRNNKDSFTMSYIFQ